MQGRVTLLFLVLFFILSMGKNIQGYQGKGTEDNPYIVSKEEEFREVLTKKSNGNSWVYVGINGNFSITKTIEIHKGRFRLYAYGKKRTIKRSGDLRDVINDRKEPKYCMKLTDNVKMVFGYGDTSYSLTLDGSAQIFSTDSPSRGWLSIGENTEVTIDRKGILKHSVNNSTASGSSAVSVKGKFTLYGEIMECKGNNGGAVNVSDNGIIHIGSTGKIRLCQADTEGGGVYISNQGQMILDGGEISECTANEEGGAVFAKGNANVKILSGIISNNRAGNTGGGIFSGIGAILHIGKTDGTGPFIEKNHADGSGGGIRCNGGDGSLEGGTTYLYGGNIRNNSAGYYGGGISVGDYGGVIPSKIMMQQVKILENSCRYNGGGIWVGSGVTGIDGKDIPIRNCQISENRCDRHAAGMKINSHMYASQNIIRNNVAKENAGGVFVSPGITYRMDSGEILDNTCNGYGAGVFVVGYFQISDSAYVNTNNRVYLSRGTYIDIVGKLTKTKGQIAYIESEQKENGTPLVRINYNHMMASSELYYGQTADDEYKSDNIVKKFIAFRLSQKQLLRPTEQVSGFENNYIIISEKYTIMFDKNLSTIVHNMPMGQAKFWNETIRLSNNKISADGYLSDEKKHWNTEKDGRGQTFAPGAIYEQNEDRTLFAQWIRISEYKPEIQADDRYYYVGQNIVLNADELLKKVRVTDKFSSDATYQLNLIKISLPDGTILLEGNHSKPEKVLNTQDQGEYLITLRAESQSGVSGNEQTMKVFVLDSLINTNQVRFISYQYFETLNHNSKWNGKLKDELLQSLQRKDTSYVISLSGTEVKHIKESVRSNGYVITKKMNQACVSHWKN